MELAEKLKILQNSLAMSDFFTKPRRTSNHNSIGFLVLKLENIKIKMYQETKHLMPHIHIDYANQNHAASFSIDPPAKIKGKIDKKYEKIITEWVMTNKEMLLEIWTEAQSGGNPDNLITELELLGNSV
jgi:hypothetical protein